MFRRAFTVVASLFGGIPPLATFELKYDQAIILDAEDLAEGGIAKAYIGLKPHLMKYVSEPISIEEVLDPIRPRYVVQARGSNHVIYDGFDDLENETPGIWVRATVVFFNLVNEQLDQSNVRFYALNGGNDLMGVFLKPEEAEDAKRSLARRTDWPFVRAWRKWRFESTEAERAFSRLPASNRAPSCRQSRAMRRPS